MRTIRVPGFSRDGNIEFTGIELPSLRIVCERCRGDGKHVNPSIDGHGLSAEDFAEDPDFREAYFSGRYDVCCEECKGERVVDVVDEAACTRKGSPLSWRKGLIRYHVHLKMEREADAERYFEQRVGA